MAVSFTVNFTNSSATVSVKTDPAYGYYRVFCRRDGGSTSTVYDTGVFAASSDFQEKISGLSPNTKYAVNVGYSSVNNGDGGVTWVGTKYFTTKGSGAFSWTYAGLDTDGEPVVGTSKQAGLGIYVTADEI